MQHQKSDEKSEENQTANIKDDYKSVMQFIQKNKQIPTLLNSFKPQQQFFPLVGSKKSIEEIDYIKESQNNISHLKKAIETGVLHHPVFENKECQLYALYLLKEKQISLQQFLSINLFLSSLIQYTASGHECIKNEDKSICKEITEVTFINVDEIKSDISKVIKNIYLQNHPQDQLNETDFQANLNNLSALDKNIIKIKKPKKSGNNENFLEESLTLAPVGIIDKDYYYIFSVGLIEIILNTLNKDRIIKFAPIYGSASPKKLLELHQLGFHPMNLYSSHIRDNPERIHGIRVGFLSMLLHDFTHVYFSNLLERKQYQFLFQEMVPAIIKVAGGEIDPMTRNFNDRGLDVVNDLAGIGTSGKIGLHAQSHLYHCVIEGIWNSSKGRTEEQILNMMTDLYDKKGDIKNKYDIDLDEMLSMDYFNPDQIKNFQLMNFYSEDRELPESDELLKLLNGQPNGILCTSTSYFLVLEGHIHYLFKDNNPNLHNDRRSINNLFLVQDLEDNTSCQADHKQVEIISKLMRNFLCPTGKELLNKLNHKKQYAL